MLCAKEKYWSHQGVIWQLVGGPGFRQGASCAQQIALFCPPFHPLMTQRTLPKPFYKSTKAVLHQNQMFPPKKPFYPTLCGEIGFRAGNIFVGKGNCSFQSLQTGFLANILS